MTSFAPDRHEKKQSEAGVAKSHSDEPQCDAAKAPATPEELPFGYGIIPIESPPEEKPQPHEGQAREPETVRPPDGESSRTEVRKTSKAPEPQGEELPFGFGILEAPEDQTGAGRSPVVADRIAALSGKSVTEEPKDRTVPAAGTSPEEPVASGLPGARGDSVSPAPEPPATLAPEVLSEEEIFQFSLAEPPEEPEEDEFERLVPPGPLEEVRFDEELRARSRRRRPRRRRRRMVEAEKEVAVQPQVVAPVEPTRRRPTGRFIVLAVGAVAVLVFLVWLALTLAR